MCPLCISTLAWAALGGSSAAGLGALIVKWGRRKGDDNDDA
jgi:hypothetical protein